MEFRTIVDIPDPGFRIGPCEEMLFVGSCFATEIGHRFQEEGFPVVVNPFGTMYNPASILHTIEKLFRGCGGAVARWHEDTSRAALNGLQTNLAPPCPRTPVPPSLVFLTLGTNHVYRLKSTGEIVDNCEKRPAALFQEEELSVDTCTDYLMQAVTLLRQVNPDIRIVLTVSPIRYRKYGYHASQLSKATLLLAVEKIRVNLCQSVAYFPAYEIVNDELRDYRFYKPDMLHPSDQAVEYIWQRLSETYLSNEAKAFIQEWAPLKAALNHKPFDAESEEYKAFMHKTMLKVEALKKKYPNFAL
ncbi:MAG: GSCFA domain-containing protein [Prevotella sp.]|nr:GSCFA domain-containing protein [Prevotella sp.]